MNASSSSSGGSSKKVGSGKKTSSKTPPLDMSGLVTIGGNSALALAVRHGNTSVVEFLLQQVCMVMRSQVWMVMRSLGQVVQYGNCLLEQSS
jgi:hypothetical protein